MKQTKEKGSDKKIHVKQKQDNSKFLASAIGTTGDFRQKYQIFRPSVYIRVTF